MKGKIAKSKRSNPKKNKIIKQGFSKKTNKPPKKILNRLVPLPAQQQDEDESDQGEDLLGMVDEEDMNYLKNAITSRSYNIYNKVKFNEYKAEGPKSKRRKGIAKDDDTLENEFEEQLDVNDDGKTVKRLLPIKTKTGIIQQQEISEQREDPENEVNLNNGNLPEEAVEEELSDEEEISLETTELDLQGPISATQLMAKRNEVLMKVKIHIGTLSAGLLENPEEKIINLRTLLSLIDEETAEIYVSIRKLLIVSLLEVFKDILPSYEIKNVVGDGTKLKKDTLKLKKYEESLLLYYKKFLQKLEKYAFFLFKKRGDSRIRTEEDITLAILAVQTMCDLLVTHPYFNFAQNIAQALVPFLNNKDKNVREIVKSSLKTIFKEDKKEEITLKILRIINHYLKNHPQTHVEILEVLLVLNLRDVNLDQEKQHDMKEKKLMSHKSRILQLSKKEKKRKKKLKEVENELLETKAEENKQTKQKNLLEITKIIFNIYFRILKNSNSTKALGVCLEGLAKFAHCINLEYYVDIVNVLDNLLKEDWLGYRERLYCIQTVFAILSGQGEALNLDPLRFYNSLYKDLLSVNSSSKKSINAPILIKILNEALIKRRKKITNKRTLGFVKRLAQLSLQLTHEGSLGCLGIVKNIMLLNRSADILLDLDPTTGEGKYQAEVDDPEYSNAASSALYEVLFLAKHYHPIVTKFARNIASGVPSTGEGSLPGEYMKSTPEQLCVEFDMSEMAFNPAVPPPKKDGPKGRSKGVFANTLFEEECKNILRKPIKRKAFWIDNF